MKKLNDEQRKLVEDNYSLIWHLHEKYFTKFKDFDTYMDLGRMVICKAALKWDESKGNFGTYFRWVLQSEINKYYIKWHSPTEKMNRNAESLDAPVDERVDAEELTIGSLLVSNDDIESQALTTVYYQGEFNKLSDKQKKIIYMLLDDIEHKYIAKEFGKSIQWVSWQLGNIKKIMHRAKAVRS